MTRSQDTGRDEERVLLPRRMDPETRRVLEEIGLKWGDKCNDFDVLWNAKLPEGWRQIFVGEGPRRRCFLVDQKGQRRAKVDTSRYSSEAAIDAINRFSVGGDSAYTTDRSAVFGLVYERTNSEDGDNFSHVIHTTVDVPTKTPYSATLDEEQEARQIAVDWLDQNYPDWRNPGAYWD